MATSMQGNTLWAAKANEDLSTYLYHFLKIDTDGGLLHAGVSAKAAGVCVETNVLGYPATVQMDGIAKITLGATLNAGVEVQPDTNGAAVASAGSPPGNSAGLLLTGGNSGEVVSVLLLK